MIKIKEVKIEELADKIELYNIHVISPMDDMYEEGIIPSCNFYKIIEEDVIGYVAINNDKVMLQFHLDNRDRDDSSNIFKEILNLLKVKKALVNTNDPYFYNLCKKNEKKSEINDYLFHEDSLVELKSPIENIEITLAENKDLDSTLAYFKSIGMEGDFINYYINLRILTSSIYLFKLNDSIIGSGEIRPSKSAKNYANVGMTVSTDYRKIGLGSYILSTLRKMANEKGLQTVCSTDVTNIASYKTIIKSGYKRYHEVYSINF